MKAFFNWLLAIIDGPKPLQEFTGTSVPRRVNKIYAETGCTCAPDIEWQDSCHHAH